MKLKLELTNQMAAIPINYPMWSGGSNYNSPGNSNEVYSNPNNING